MTTTSDWSEDQPDGQTGNERAGRCTSASDRKCPPPQSMSQHSDGNRPAQHTQGRREEDAVSGNSDPGGDHVEPEGHSSAGLAHRRGNAEKAQSKEESG